MTVRQRLVTGRLRAVRLPAGLLGMFALVLLIESGVARIDQDFASSGPWDWQLAARRVKRAAPGRDVLCFGDSQMKLGALPRVIEARTGRPAYNLALIGGQVPAATVLLRRVLETGARPGTVLIAFIPPLMAGGIDRNDRQWPELLDPGECLELARTEGDAALFGRLMVARLLPSVRARLDIRGAVHNALAGTPVSKSSERAMHHRNWVFNRGAMLLPRYGDERDIETWYRVNYPGPWRCDSTNAAYLNRFLRLAAENSVNVHWLLAPVDPEAQALAEAGGQDAQFERFVRAAVSRYPNLSVIDARHSGFDRSAFTDTVHLHSGGAYALSEALAEVLGPTTATSDPATRWVSLPAYRPRPHDVPIEDISQSQLAIWMAEEHRR